MWRLSFYRTGRTVVLSQRSRMPGRRVLSTTESSSAAQPFHQRIVSRRALQEYNKNHPPPRSTKAKPKEEKTEWPRNLQIAGYVALAVGIPYSIAMWIAYNATVREAMGEYIPNLEDFLRSYFGTPEEDEVSYTECQEGVLPHLILPDEPSFRERQQQEEVHALDTHPTPLRITLIQDGQPILTTSSKSKVPGWTMANTEALLELAGEKVTDTENVEVAVDFEDLKHHHKKGEEGEPTLTDELTVSLNDSRKSPKQFLHSTWYYQPPIADNNSKPLMSSEEVEISRLEYEIQQLEANLKDINCTRSMDDMQRELKESKSQLRKIVWKRRLRLK